MKQSKLKTRVTHLTQVIDSDTGELIEENVKHHTYIADSKEQFMLLYVNLLPTFIKLSNPAKIVYAYLLMSYDTSITFEIGAGTRSLIAEYASISTSAVANAITELRNERLLYSSKKSLYQINPRYAFKGSTKDRSKALKAIIELGCSDC